MNFELQKRIPSGQKFGRKADPTRPYVWVFVASSNDRALLEDMRYKLSDGDKAQDRNFRIIDKR